MLVKSHQKVRISEITGGEAREILARRPVILVPLGSHEDQGPHAPMGDYLFAERIAELIAERASERGTTTLVAPVLPFGGANYFGNMPGGIALAPATFRAVLADMFACLLRHGLSRLIVINGHDGNVPIIHEVSLEIYLKKNALIPSFYLWRIADSLLPSIVGAEKASRTSGHGADAITSVVMHLRPELIRSDLIPGPPSPRKIMGMPVSGVPTVKFEEAEIAVPVEFDELASDGVSSGDPRLCSAETGAALVERITELGARFVEHYAQHSA
jgi:creatinine amidohydrolase